MEKDVKEDLQKYFKVSKKLLEILLDAGLTYNEMVVVLKYTDTILTLLESNVLETTVEQLKKWEKA